MHYIKRHWGQARETGLPTCRKVLTNLRSSLDFSGSDVPHPRCLGTAFAVNGIVYLMIAGMCLSGIGRHSSVLANYMPKGMFQVSPARLMYYKITFSVSLVLGSILLPVGILLLKNRLKDDPFYKQTPAVQKAVRIYQKPHCVDSLRLLGIIAGIGFACAVFSMLLHNSIHFHAAMSKVPSLPPGYRIFIHKPQVLEAIYRGAVNAQNMALFSLLACGVVGGGMHRVLRPSLKGIEEKK